MSNINLLIQINMFNLLIQIISKFNLIIQSKFVNYQSKIRLYTGSITILTHKSNQNHINNKDTQLSKEGRKYSLSHCIQLIIKLILTHK